MVVLNFDNADIETVIHAASEIVGFNYVLAPDVRGKVTVQTSGRIAAEDVFGVLLAILEVQGFTAVKAGSLYKIMRIEGARERAVPTVIGGTPDPNRTTDEVITQIVPIRYTNANDLSALLRPLVSNRGSMIANRETNILAITDSASNVRRLLDIVRIRVAARALHVEKIEAGEGRALITFAATTRLDPARLVHAIHDSRGRLKMKREFTIEASIAKGSWPAVRDSILRTLDELARS